MGWANEQRLAAQQKKVADLHEAMSTLRNKEQDAENAMHTANARREALLNQADAKEQAIAEEQGAAASRVNQLTRGARLYKKLGLEFQREDNSRLKIAFTNVDPADPSRLFFFVVFVDQDEQYHIEQVEPGVGSIADLMHRLNETNDFSSFVRNMRKKFQALC